MAVFTALIGWLLLRGFEWFCLHMGWKIKIERLVLFIGTFVLLVAMVWVLKRLIWSNTPVPLILKGVVWFCVTLATTYLTWLFRNKPGIIHERITPLVWLFGILVMFSVPLVAYYTWVKQPDNILSQKISQPSITDKNRPNIVLVTFDALTARDMSVYGYHRPTTPFITEWVKSASLFTRLEAESNWTTPTTASLMTGKRVWTHQTYHSGGSKPVKSDIENVAFVLKDNGYFNMDFVVNPLASVEQLGISNSFEIAPLASEFRTRASLVGIIEVTLYRLFADKIRLYDWLIKTDFVLFKLLKRLYRNFSKTEVPPEKAFNRFLAVIDDNPPEPFFARIHLLPPHAPYLPPEPYMGMFDSLFELRSAKSQWKVFKHRHFTPEMQPTIDTLRVYYDEFIRYCDKQFEDFIREFKKRDKFKNTIVILSSDHGEIFEHNSLEHGRTLYEPETNIPLIIKEPNQTEARIINDLVEQIDIPPTILDLAHVPVPSWMEGRSLVPLLRDKMLPSKPAFSMDFQRNPSRGHQITRGTIAVWEGDYKLIYYLEENKSLLFNLKEDPNELENLFDKESEIGQRLLALIQENLKKANEKISKEK